METNNLPTDGYTVIKFGHPTKRIVQTLELRDNPELIKHYRQLHSRKEIWPEIIEGIKAVGILEMEIFIHRNHLVMILEVPADFNWNDSMTRLATLPRQAEWEETVSQFQQALPGQSSSEKWQPMQRMFYLYD